MKRNTIVGVVVGCALASPVLAEDSIHPETGNVKISTGLGWLGGESKEYVYNPNNGQKMSELDWKIKNIPIIKGDISWDALNWLTVNARGWVTLSSSGSGGMDDYDWVTPGQEHWSHWSTHPNTRLNHANEFDVNIRGWLLNKSAYRFGAILGYQQTRFSWTAFGGSYIYDNGGNIGTFPRDERGIGYKQQFSLPYLGIVGAYRYQNFEFNGLLKFSPWVKAKDNDEHYARDTTFRVQADNLRYYSATVDAGYYVTPKAKVYTEFSASKYEEGQGGMQSINTITGKSDYLGGNAAGIENVHYSVTVGLKYRF
ncbi:omptin family outer membrane protease [Xenorhabdus sp. 12]|uniref:Omptin family outer membrane protease n=1 Tax=Xenorhabdus santafensis TaxID=2582833 RepID=A0ABU4S8E1_9GAMM|nr:omptin family outer membrane protease [Xenorhabdus sp. 12]MDX7987047.1 omptin family outer membrane protease [Xenorhabdus sp. 12]